MSSISSIGGSSLSQFLQGLTGTSQSSGASATTAATPTSATSSAASSAASTGPAVQGSGRRHHGHGMKQIQDAVTSALQSAQASGSSSDPNQIVEDAISKVLQNNPSAAGTQADPDGDGSTQSASESGSSSATTGTSGTGSSQKTFLQMLQSYGVDPQQFHQDFLAAVKDAQNGTSSSGTAFQSFPVGSTLDTVG